MRGITLFASSSLLLSVICVSLAPADIVPGDSHLVNREVRILNLDQFPGFVLVGFVTGPMIETYEVHEIRDDQPLTKGYKFNSLQLLAIPSNLLETIGGLAEVDFQQLTRRMEPAGIVDPHGGHVSNDNPLVAERYEYLVESASASRLVLKLERKVSTFSDGQPERIEEF